MKRLFKLFLSVSIIASVIGSVAYADYMYVYKPEGHRRWVPESEVAQMKKEGWYEYPVVKLYALDGRTKVYSTEKVEAQIKVGWYRENHTMYKPDGRSKTVNWKEIKEALNSGWYPYPVTTLFAPDGRSKVYSRDKVQAQLEVGWYTYPVTKLYNGKGEKIVVSKGNVESYTNDRWNRYPWYEYPVVRLYAPDGREVDFKKEEAEAQKTVGWYDYPVERMYTIDGRSAVFAKTEVEAQKTVGWYQEYTEMFNVSGGIKYVLWSDINKEKKHGWYLEPIDIGIVDKRDWLEKEQRIFPDGNYYTEKWQATANMVSVTVPVWLMKSNGTKYSSTTSVTVHKALAEDLKKVFQEIYNHPSKFPIKSVSGFSWRNTAGGSVSQHSYGTCIDINPNENYYVTPDGRAVTGSLWQPGVNPYSISGDSIVVNAFAKYGWEWGGNCWGDSYNKDYMHFTYLGG